MTFIVLLSSQRRNPLKWAALFYLSRSNLSWKQGGCLFFSFFTLLTPIKTLAANENSPEIAQPAMNGDPIVGKTTSATERCQECHGEDGNSTDSRIPKHAGQNTNYLIKQLRDFQSGARQHEVMSVMAEDLTETDIANIAAYFASLKTMQGVAGKAYPLASQLFFQGDKARAIAPCQSCHGDKGKGKQLGNTGYPVIGGQNKNYLRAQLVSWKLGERTNSPDGVMNHIAKLLTDEEIEALANYVSGL